MSKVYCSNCGAEVILPEKSCACSGTTISKETKGDYVIPMKMSKAEERLATLKANGIDTSNYFTLTNQDGEGVLMKWDNGTPVIVDEDPVIAKIYANGYVKNTQLHRRFVLAQMWSMINYKSWDGKCRGYEDALRDKGYQYQWDMMVEEMRVQTKLDYDSFIQRNNFFNKDVVVHACEDYYTKLKRNIDIKKRKKCKGVPYVTLAGENTFVDDLDKKIFFPMKNHIRLIKVSNSADELYKNLNMFYRRYVKKYRLVWDTPLDERFKDAYKGAGSYYSLLNLVQFHECVLIDTKGIAYRGVDAVRYINSKLDEYKGEGWRYFAMLKKCIKDNN